MAKVRIELNSAGVQELLKGSSMQSVLSEHARAISGNAGEGYSQDIYVGKTRANAMVYADTYQAKKDNLENNTLLKAVR